MNSFIGCVIFKNKAAYKDAHTYPYAAKYYCILPIYCILYILCILYCILYIVYCIYILLVRVHIEWRFWHGNDFNVKITNEKRCLLSSSPVHYFYTKTSNLWSSRCWTSFKITSSAIFTFLDAFWPKNSH